MPNQIIKPFDDEILDVKKQSLYARLKRLFSTDVIVRNVGGKQLKIKDTDSIMYATDRNSLRDRFNRIRSTAYNAYSRDFALSYQAARMDLFRDYDCVGPDTIIPLPDGTRPNIKELSEKYKDKPQERFHVFSYDHKTDSIKIGKAFHPRKKEGGTRMGYKVTFDNGQFVIGSIKHPFLMRNGEYKMIADLKVGESVMPFYQKLFYPKKRYRHIYNFSKGWQAEHKIIAKQFYRPLLENDVVHHKNFTPSDNSPDNLKIMTKSEHSSYHMTLTKDVIWSPENKQKTLEKVRNSDGYKNRKFHHWNGERKGKNNPFYGKQHSDESNEKRSETLKEVFVNRDQSGNKNPKFREDLTIEILNTKATDYYKNNGKLTSWGFVKDIGCDYSVLQNRLKNSNTNWNIFKKEITSTLNHKIKSIESIGEIDVYDVTVEHFENFATDSCFVHNTMDMDPILSSALDVYSDESLTYNEMGKMLTIHSNNNNVKQILENLFTDILNIQFNLWSWTRNLVKYGDFFLKLYITPEYGIYMVEPVSAYNVERIENADPYNKRYVKFQLRPTDTAQAEILENYEMAHFRLMSDSNFLPYGKSMIEGGRRVWKQLCLHENSRIWMAEGGFKLIKDINENDLVISFDYKTGQYKKTKVKRHLKIGKDQTYKISTSHRTIIATENHKLMVGNGSYKQVKDLTLDDELICVDNINFDEKRNNNIKTEKIRNIEESELVDVYDFEVDDDLHNFVCDGVISSNSLMEDAMLIHRIMRAPEKRIFYTDIGNIPPAEVDNYMQKMMDKMKKVPYMDEQSGEYNLRFNLQPVRQDTKVPLLDGRTISIKELAQEYNNGKKNYVYSVDREDSGRICAGAVLWCGLTKENSDLVRVVLDDDSYADFAPDHPVMLRNGEYKSAKDLKENDSLMPFFTALKNDGGMVDCEVVLDPKTEKYVFTHRMVAQELNINEYGNQHSKNVVCHKYYNKYNKSLKNSEFTVNHKVKQIIFLSEKDDVYCMNVEKYHNFALDTFGGENKNGFFVKNTMMEDYYIPVRGGDSGTKIDTLGGMEWTGTEDIEYLRNKLMAALKIPKPFLGYDEATSGKSTLASEDVRFARTIQRIQRIICSELTKIAIVHLYAQGYRDESLVDFELELTNPSTIFEKEKIEIFSDKVSVATDMVENKFFSYNWIYKNIFNMSDDDAKIVRDEVVEDAKQRFRFTSIEEDGDDPAKPFSKIGNGKGGGGGGGSGGGGGGGGLGGGGGMGDLGDLEGGPEGEGPAGEGEGEGGPEGGGSPDGKGGVEGEEENPEDKKKNPDEEDIEDLVKEYKSSKKVDDRDTSERDQSGEHDARRDHPLSEDPLGDDAMDPDQKKNSEGKKKSAITHNYEGGSPLRLREQKTQLPVKKVDSALFSSLSEFMNKTHRDTAKELIKENQVSGIKSLLDEKNILSE